MKRKKETRFEIFQFINKTRLVRRNFNSPKSRATRRPRSKFHRGRAGKQERTARNSPRLKQQIFQRATDKSRRDAGSAEFQIVAGECSRFTRNNRRESTTIEKKGEGTKWKRTVNFRRRI